MVWRHNKRYTLAVLFTDSSSIASLKREIEELQRKDQTKKSVMRRLAIKIKALKLLQDEANCSDDDDDVDELEQ